MKMVVSALLVGASMLVSAPASAATLVYNFSGGDAAGTYIQLFNRTLGTLNSATFDVTFSSYATVRRGFDNDLPAINGRAAGSFGLRSEGFPTIDLIPAQQFFGQSNFAAGSLTGTCSISGNISNTLTTSLGNLTGAGQVRANPSGSVSVCDGGQIDIFGPSTSFSGTVTYNFTAAVPEPATWAMMLVGFAMLGGARRHQNSARKRVRAA